MKKWMPRVINWAWQKKFQCIYAFGGKVVGARALVFQDNQVLLANHTYVEGWYTLGGLVDRCETPLAAIKRELQEEAGLQVTEEPKLFNIYHNTARKKDDYVFLYIVNSFTMVECRCPEIEECRFFPIHNLPEGTSEATKRRIQEYLGEIPIAETW